MKVMDFWRFPEISPALIMFMERAEKTSLCLAMLSESGIPSSTSSMISMSTDPRKRFSVCSSMALSATTIVTLASMRVANCL